MCTQERELTLDCSQCVRVLCYGQREKQCSPDGATGMGTGARREKALGRETELVLGRYSIELTRAFMQAHMEASRSSTSTSTSTTATGRANRLSRFGAGFGGGSDEKDDSQLLQYSLAPGLTLSLAVRYSPPEHTIRRTPSRVVSGLFGVPLHLILRSVHFMHPELNLFLILFIYLFYIE